MRNKRRFINVQLLDGFRVGMAAEGAGCGRGTNAGDCSYWGNANEMCGDKTGIGYGGGTTINTQSCNAVGRGEG